MNRLRFLVMLFGAVLALATFGCGGDGGGPDGGGKGTLSVMMSDGLDPSVTAVNVTISRVEANVDGNWTGIPVQTSTVNLLDLNMSAIKLAQGDIPSGHYTQVRVFIHDVSVTDSGGTHTVVIPGSIQTGIKLNVDYDIHAGDVTTLLMDFNADLSLDKVAGQWVLHPVIPVMVKVLSGTMTGSVVFGGSPAPGTHVVATYTGGPGGVIGTPMTSTWTNASGNFKLWALFPGHYNVEFRQTDGTGTHVASVFDVNIAANTNTDVGTVTLN